MRTALIVLIVAALSVLMLVMGQRLAEVIVRSMTGGW